MELSILTTSAIWLRPGLRLGHFLENAGSLDTALFDVDGVLIDTSRSYRYAVAYASEHLVRVVNRLSSAPSPMVSGDDIAVFKLAGGFNSDWDATQLFAGLWTARLREWHGHPEADLSIEDWAASASAAAREQRGGLAWLYETVPASAIPDGATARWAHDEFYWGAELARQLYGHEPTFAPEAPGFVHNEELLFTADLFTELRKLGIAKFGLITGRADAEVNWAVERLGPACDPQGEHSDGWYDSEYGRSPFASIVSADTYVKPDPRALIHALESLGSQAALFAGDTADDLDLVLRYRQHCASRGERCLPVLAVAIACGEQARTYQERGADIVIPQIGDLPQALAALASEP
jgi:phosphoglycolate phosphatase-like HAD superfamily hydrolase